jgi:hypothetical protein
MGVRALDLADWVDVDPASLAGELALKRELLAERYDDVVAVLDPPASEAVGRGTVAWRAAAELDRAVADWWRADGRPPPPEPDGSWHPVVRAGLRTQEDWCLLAPVEADGPPVLVAACVCFPTRWILREKLGLPMSAIHGPVASYAEQLAAPADRFLARLAVDRPVWRANWNLVDDAALFQGYLPERGRRLDVGPDEVADRVFLRVERQTLRRLRETGAIAFGIRVHQRSLRSLADRTADLRRLLDAVDALPPATFAYKGLGAFWDPLRTWLVEIAGAGE